MTTIAGCKPHPEAQAKAQEHQQEQCLNQFCPGDIEPKHDAATEITFKRAGRWLIGPKEYGFYEGNGLFYWPSKTSGQARVSDFPEKALIASGKSESAVVNFYVQAQPSTGETYGFVEEAEAQKTIVKREQLRPGLERVERKSEPGKLGRTPLYVATSLKTPSGLPPVASCDEAHPDNYCTSGFVWKPGLRVGVRFNQRHARDWPEIYNEIMRVLHLTREP